MASDTYESPFGSRYASAQMSYLFSPLKKFRTWRKLWIFLAESEKELGLNITDEQINQMREHEDDINFDVAKQREKEVRHDVMSHVYAYGVQCPKAKPIIHLGATSCFVGDNTDIIIMREALGIIEKKLAVAVRLLSDFALKYADTPCLGYTHFQPAQPTTVGKRATLWTLDFLNDLKRVKSEADGLLLLGSKGTTGTQASFCELFGGDYEKALKLDALIALKAGFKGCVPVSGQTYSRKTDSFVLSCLSAVAQSCSKFAGDIRLLQHLKEVEEPFEKFQIGSSAMAYKRNPMRCERISSLSRHLIINCVNPQMTASVQWLERSLDDSANRRISISEAFLAADGLMDLVINVADGLVVYEKMALKHLYEELPFMATENILMEAVKRGGDRQELHERIRVYSMEAGQKVKNGEKNELLDMIAADPMFKMTPEEIERSLDPSSFTGFAKEQTMHFVKEEVEPALKEYASVLNYRPNIEV